MKIIKNEGSPHGVPAGELMEKYLCYAIARDAFCSLKSVESETAPEGEEAQALGAQEYEDCKMVQKALESSGLVKLLHDAEISKKVAENNLLECMIRASEDADYDELKAEIESNEELRDEMLFEAESFFEPSLFEEFIEEDYKRANMPPIPPAAAIMLFHDIAEGVNTVGCKCDFTLTKKFSKKHGQDEDVILEWAKENDRLCDCEIVYEEFCIVLCEKAKKRAKFAAD